MKRYSALVILTVLLQSCFPYLYRDKREKVLLECVNIDESLKIAEHRAEWGGLGESLGLWAMRDQIITAEQAARANEIYLKHINKMTSGFSIWHFSWAVANMYRLGDHDVKWELQDAYKEAQRQHLRAPNLSAIIQKHVTGPEILMGDAHGGGRAFAQKHLVIPCNDKYVNSYQDYLARMANKKRPNPN